jgi:spermidine synthase
MYTQLMVGHIPLLLSTNPETAMVVGLGSGATLAAAAQYPLKQITCVEIEPAVVEASQFFKAENNNVLEDPRVKLVETDARNYLAVNPQKYDVIISQPSNLWVAGMANLFSLEFYQICKKRLNPGGILCQWAHIYHISQENLKIVINTFRTVFPHISIWYTIPGDIMMIGSADDITFDYLQIAKNYGIHSVRTDLQRLDIREPLALMSCYIMDSKGVERLVAGSRINTDDRPILEFSVPRSVYRDTTDSNHDLLFSFRTDEFPEMKNFNRQRVTSRASFWYHLGISYDFKGMPDEARNTYKKAISVDESFAPAYEGLALNMYRNGQIEDAIKNLKKAIELDPSEADAYYNLAQIYHNQGSRDEAVSNYEKAIKLSPQPWKYQQKLADLFMEYGEYWGAIRRYESALKSGINKSRILYSMAKAYNEMGMTDAAIARLKEAIAVDPSFTPPDKELSNLFDPLIQ